MPTQINRSRLSRTACVFTAFVVCSPIAATAAAQTNGAPADFQDRLKKLETVMEEARVENHIPGLAIAVVKDDKIVFSKGFGSRDLENKKPVETSTRFAIGSSTKAFTAALIGMLVDDGKMKWDDPVSRHIPDFKLDVETGDEDITVRDLLCHRTGLTRLSLLWAGGSQSRAEVISSARKAKAYAKFREKFLYNNVMYMTAGFSAGKATGSDWDSLISERIFKPLGMTSSNTTMAAAQSDKEMSLGYMWDKDAKDYTQLPMRSLDTIAPAGAINSNVTDMAQWLRFQLSKGKFDDKQLLSEEQHAETWKKQIAVGGGVNYGLGWMLREWNGKKVVEHGGNIDGFGAQVTLLPEMNAGYVLLTNVTVTPLQGGSVGLVFDTLFGEEKAERDLADINTEELTGKYIANFGPFSDTVFEVMMKDGKLAVDVPGQTTYELKSPNEEGKWYFALTDTIAVSFNKNDKDKVISMQFYQGGMEPEFLREDYEPKPDSPLNVTAPIVGKYHDEQADLDINVSVKKGRIVVKADKQGTFSLLPPTDGGLWKLRALPDAIQFRFNKNDDGTIKSMTRIQGGKEVEMARVDKAATSTIPSTEELVALMKKGAGSWKDGKIAGVKMIGTANFVHQGVAGKIEKTFTPDGKHLTHHDLGKLVTMTEAYNGKQGFSDTSISRFEETKGDALTALKMRHPAWVLLDWQKFYTDIAITGESKVDGKKTFVVALSGEGIPERTLHVDASSGLILKEKFLQPVGDMGQLPIDMSYSDYRNVGGAMLAFRITSDSPAMGSAEVTLKEAEELSTVSDSIFTLEPSAK